MAQVKIQRAHRFFPMEPDNFYIPGGRGRRERYTIIEISLLFERIPAAAQIFAADIEITITEAPRCNWNFRGLPGDEIGLDYQVEV